MNELKTLIENSGGLKSLDQLLKIVADALNITVTQLQNNLPDYLTQIGKYGLIDNIMGRLGLLYVSIIIYLSISVIICIETDSSFNNRFKKCINFIWISFIPFGFFLMQQVLLYWASPQIYALKYLKELLGI